MTAWQDRFMVIPAVYLLLRRDGKVLLARRCNTGYSDGLYSTPAGHLEGGESAVQALAREAKEEIDVVIRPEDLQLMHTLHRIAEEGDHERIDLFFAATNWKGEPKNMEPHKCDDLQWFDETALPDNIIPVVAQALRHIAAGEPFSTIGFK